MTEPKLDEPLISKETWALSIMGQLRTTLTQIDPRLARVCDWNGLFHRLNETRKNRAPAFPVSIKPKEDGDSDPLLNQLISQKPFQSLALITQLNQVLTEINPDYQRRLPRLSGLTHQLESLLIESGYQPAQFDRALTRVGVAL